MGAYGPEAGQGQDHTGALAAAGVAGLICAASRLPKGIWQAASMSSAGRTRDSRRKAWRGKNIGWTDIRATCLSGMKADCAGRRGLNQGANRDAAHWGPVPEYAAAGADPGGAAAPDEA